jgi:S-adenosylmethionine hydrolase
MIITLLSDFGYQDNFIAVAKGILLQQLPAARLIDLNHEVEPFHLLQCSYLLKSAYADFPGFTVHLSLFDILHTHPARLLITRMGDHFIICADNGLLPLSFGEKLGPVYSLPETAASYVEWLYLAAGFIKKLEVSAFSLEGLSEVTPKENPSGLKALIKGDALECQVIHIDRYENVVINITREQFDEQRKGRDFQISFARDSINKISERYSDVPEGEKLCLFNSAGYMEIAINHGQAASLLGLRLYRERQLVYQNIKIDFI